ncbi:uncharacterized protein BDV17DRAFT_5089 [Aspergillus undulatus]|uniref:uncharacterized protein n=1 Tax=Aspergillus undulatus TaxID=1810928 RepID=UPI003CCE2831
MDLLQWEASVVLDQGRAEIIDLLVMESTKHSHEINCGNESVSAHGEGVESLGGQASGKLPQHLTEWISNLEPPSSSFEEHIGKYSDTGHDPMQDPPYHELPDHEKFIYASEAYRWLLAKIRQHQQIEQRDSCLVSDIGSMICSRLRAEQGLRTLSRRKASLVTMTFWLDWYPPPYLWSLGMTLSSSSNILEKVLCLTGTWNEAQLMTVAEYIRQTWPVTGEHMITFVQRLLVDLHEAADVLHRLPGPQSAEIRAKFQHSSEYQISVTGSPYLVSEIGEGIGWLISVLRVPPSTRSKGIATCSPRILDLDLRAESTENPEVVVVGTCQLVARFHDKITRPNSAPGFCWGPLFSRAVLVTGFPVLRRHEAETGLEMSIGIMSYLIRSRQVVQWGERIIMKGFSSLVIATVAASNTIVWHLLTSDSPTERISYIHPRLDTVDMKPSANVSLQSLEHSRHIVGWCPSAVEYCGHATALQSISASGLPSPPPSIIIDRLYLEGGAQVVGGFSMGINNKENPFWLERESDYPSLIKWISSQPIVFYDISDSRAWLVDGVSALLHLVRVSLHLDQTDPESPYEWVFDASALKDTWNGSSTGRLAALKTLTCWDNLKLPLYVKDNTNHARGSRRQSEKRYSTLGDRVKKIMHSIEILLDRQVKAASQDGIKISQTLSTQRSIVGFDILDVINPLGPIHARIKHMPSRSHGWIDLIQTLGVTTIFGKGFGDLIQPSAPDVICSRWKLVPTGMDYLAASVSTLNMLYDKRLLRLEPGLGLGEMTNKIIWVSTTGQPFEACECMSSAGRSANGHGPCKFHPVQYLVSKRPWKLNIIPRGSTPIDLASLERTGAVVFGHLSSLGRRKGSNSTDGIPQHLKANEPVLLSARATDTSQGSIGTSRSSTVGSGSDNVQSTVSTQSTGITAPSILSSGENKEVVQRDESKWRLKVRDRKVLKKWMKWVWS